MFDALGEWFAEEGYRSCMFIKAASEFPDSGHAIHMQSAEHKRLLLQHTRMLAEKAGYAEPDLIARQLMLLKEGAIVVAHMGHTSDPAADGKQAAAVLLAAD
jgi:hypothetical protein